MTRGEWFLSLLIVALLAWLAVTVAMQSRMVP